MNEFSGNTTLLRRGLLIVCAIAGAGLAMHDILIPAAGGFASDLQPGIVAQVGSTQITLARYRDVLADMETDRRGELTQEDRKFALQRLIDEQLLIDRALELNLDAVVPTVRKSLASAAIAHVAAESNAVAGSDAELRKLYDEEHEFFSQPARYRVRWYRSEELEAHDKQKALEWQRTVGEGGPDSVLANHGFAQVHRLPGSSVPASTLSNYLGATLTSSIERMKQGEYSVPVYQNAAWHVLFLEERLPSAKSSFESLGPLLQAEFKRRNADAALRDYLRWLAERTDIRIDSEFE